MKTKPLKIWKNNFLESKYLMSFVDLAVQTTNPSYCAAKATCKTLRALVGRICRLDHSIVPKPGCIAVVLDWCWHGEVEVPNLLAIAC